MKKLFASAIVLTGFAGFTLPTLAAEQKYTGAWPSGSNVTLTVKDGKKVRYCTQGLSCLRGTFGVSGFGSENNFAFRRGKKGVDGSWGMRATKTGNCYNLKYVWRANGKTNEMKTKAC